MTIFSGFFFTLALHLQDGLGYSPLRAGLTFAPAAATFALVSLNWRRLPARWHGALIVAGFVAFAAAMAGLAAVLRDGGSGGAGHLPDRRAQRCRDGGRVQPADDPGAAARAGRAGRGRDRGGRHGEPARPARRRGHVRHALPQPGRAAARGCRPARRVPARVRSRRGDHLPRPGRPGCRGRPPGHRPHHRAARTRPPSPESPGCSRYAAAAGLLGYIRACGKERGWPSWCWCSGCSPPAPGSPCCASNLGRARPED